MVNMKKTPLNTGTKRDRDGDPIPPQPPLPPPSTIVGEGSSRKKHSTAGTAKGKGKGPRTSRGVKKQGSSVPPQPLPKQGTSAPPEIPPPPPVRVPPGHPDYDSGNEPDEDKTIPPAHPPRPITDADLYISNSARNLYLSKFMDRKLVYPKVIKSDFLSKFFPNILFLL